MSAIPREAVSGAQKSRKRPRAARACESCRAKKYKCDEAYPCTQCKRQKNQCVYEGAAHIRRNLHPSSYVADLERQLQELSAKVETGSGKDSEAAAQHKCTPHECGPNLDQSTTYYVSGKGSVATDRLRVPEVETWKANRIGSDGEDPGLRSDHESIQDTGGEIRDVNQHTKSIEFHGNTSSMAFLALVQNQSQSGTSPSGEQVGQERPSLVSTLHNVAFSPDSNVTSPIVDATAKGENYYFRQAGRFLDGYFENLHFIHPILEKEGFLARCEDLWFGRSERQTRSFIALYYSILSLGALVRVWDESLLDGMNRFQWSRKLFTHARVALRELNSTNDLETIQCLIFMAKVCQNEINPHLAYMYLGMAVRASLSAGYHRENQSKAKSQMPPETTNIISKTWWGLYSLEVEMCFSLGRPDSVGMEDYHNQRLPSIDDSEIAIITCMIPFARITRKVSVAQLSRTSMREKIAMANEIEKEMDSWLDTLPETIRPGMAQKKNGIKILKDPKWARRQRLVLWIRYCNVKMVLFRPFLAYASQSQHRIPALLEATVAKCVDAAKKTIEIMHDTYCHHVFFRSWWYNTTYILYAASIILCYATQSAPVTEKPDLFRLVDMTVEILNAMEECFVAAKAGEMIRQAATNARQQEEETPAGIAQPTTSVQDYSQHQAVAPDWSANSMLDTQMPYISMDTMFDFDDPEYNFAMEDMQFMFAPC